MKKPYPHFTLYWETTKTNKKKLYTKLSVDSLINKISKIKAIKSCWFVIEYASPSVKRGGYKTYYINESITYTNPKDLAKAVRIFTTKNEIDPLIKSLV